MSVGLKANVDGTSGAVQVNGTDVVTVNASGQVGVGTSSPSNKFQVSGDGVRSAAQAATTAGQAFLEAQASDYWSGPSYAGAALSQYGSAATGTTVGLSNASLGMLRFQNGSAGLIYTNGTAPIVFGTNSVERMRIDSAGNITLAGKILPDVQSVTSAATVTPNADADTMVSISAQAVGLTIAAPSGTSSDGQKLIIRIKDNGGSQTIGWNAAYVAAGATLPTSTTAGKWHHIGLIYNSNTSTWMCVAATVQA